MYHLYWLFAKSNEFLLGRNGNIHEDSKLCVEILQRNISSLQLLVLKVIVLLGFNLLASLSEIAFTLFITGSMIGRSNICVFIKPSRVSICMVCGGDAGWFVGWEEFLVRMVGIEGVVRTYTPLEVVSLKLTVMIKVLKTDGVILDGLVSEGTMYNSSSQMYLEVIGDEN